MFSNIFASELERITDVLLENRQVSIDDPISLVMNSDRPEVRELVVSTASEIRQRFWNNQLFLMPPLYISSGDPKHGG